MRALEFYNRSPYYEILNCDEIMVLSRMLINGNMILFLDIYHEDDITNFVELNKITIMNKLLKIQGEDNLLKFLPYVKSTAELRNEIKQQDWGYSSIVLDKNTRLLFFIRGLEDGIRIKETMEGLYNQYLDNYYE